MATTVLEVYAECSDDEKYDPNNEGVWFPAKDTAIALIQKLAQLAPGSGLELEWKRPPVTHPLPGAIPPPGPAPLPHAFPPHIANMAGRGPPMGQQGPMMMPSGVVGPGPGPIYGHMMGDGGPPNYANFRQPQQPRFPAPNAGPVQNGRGRSPHYDATPSPSEPPQSPAMFAAQQQGVMGPPHQYTQYTQQPPPPSYQSYQINHSSATGNQPPMSPYNAQQQYSGQMVGPQFGQPQPNQVYRHATNPDLQHGVQSAQHNFSRPLPPSPSQNSYSPASYRNVQ